MAACEHIYIDKTIRGAKKRICKYCGYIEELKGVGMANSLRAKIIKLRHDGYISNDEYSAFIKKMDGHDKEVRLGAITECGNIIKDKIRFPNPNDEYVFKQNIDKLCRELKLKEYRK